MYSIDQIESVRAYRDDAEDHGLDGRPLNWREELDRDEPERDNEDRPTPTEDPQAVAVRDLYAWKRRKPGRAVHLGDGYVMLSEPGSAPIAWPCAGGELPAAEIHCFCTRELFATMADLVAADMERLP